MNTKELTTQLAQKRSYLHEAGAGIDALIQSKSDVALRLGCYERALNNALTQEHQNSDEIRELRERVNHYNHLYIHLGSDIAAHQRDVEVTKREIKDLEWLLSTPSGQKSQSSFYPSKKDNSDKEDRQNSGTPSQYSNNSSFSSMR
jgi:chromosome segregation ATPase